MLKKRLKLLRFIKQSVLLSYPALTLLHCYRAFGFRRKFFHGKTDYEMYFQKISISRLEDVSRYRLNRYKKVASVIEAGGGGSVLDVALGDGTTLLYLKKYSKSITKLAGSDISILSVENGRKMGFECIHSNINHTNEEMIKKIFPDGVDWILAHEVIEHVAESESALLKLLTLAKKGVLVSVPNTGYFPFRLQLLMGRFPVQWDLWPGEHLRFWTFSDFRWWLKILKIEGKPIVYLGFPLLSHIFKNLLADGILWHLKPKY